MYEIVQFYFATVTGDDTLDLICNGTRILKGAWDPNHASDITEQDQTQLRTLIRQRLEYYATKQNVEALLCLAALFSEGSGGIEKDLETSFRYYLQAAELGNANALFTVGLMYMKGYDIFLLNDLVAGLSQPEVDPATIAKEGLVTDEKTGSLVFVDEKSKKKRLADEKRKTLPLRPALIGVTPRIAQSKLKESKKLGREFISRAAEKGHARAQYMLSTMHEDGSIDVQRNQKMAFDLLVQSAQNNDEKAMYKLACLLLEGQDAVPISEDVVKRKLTPKEAPEMFFKVEQDQQKALQYFHKSAELGNVAAQYWLGHAYHRGNLVVKNVTLALEYLNKAADANNGEATYYVALMYRTGDEVAKDLLKWEQYFQRALDVKHGAALYCLADMYYHGKDGRPCDIPKAIELYTIAAQQGDANAWYCLGALHYHGNGVMQDFRKAYDCYARSAMAGNDQALIPMASMSLKGEGVPKDEKYAKHLLSVIEKMAANNK